jgi:hypothetical protein
LTQARQDPGLVQEDPGALVGNLDRERVDPIQNRGNFIPGNVRAGIFFNKIAG